MEGPVAAAVKLHQLASPTFTGVDVLPSTDQLLLLFARASESHNLAEKAVKERIQQAVDGKNTLTTLSSDIQTITYHKDGDADVASAKPIIDKIDAFLADDNLKDPTTRSALESARKVAVMGAADGQTDDILTKDDVKKIDTIISNTVSSIDADMQTKTMALKQEADYFNSITALIKEIMDGNSKVFNTIMARG